jgi:hypothetical protein
VIDGCWCIWQSASWRTPCQERCARLCRSAPQAPVPLNCTGGGIAAQQLLNHLHQICNPGCPKLCPDVDPGMHGVQSYLLALVGVVLRVGCRGWLGLLVGDCCHKLAHLWWVPLHKQLVESLSCCAAANTRHQVPCRLGKVCAHLGGNQTLLYFE